MRASTRSLWCLATFWAALLAGSSGALGCEPQLSEPHNDFHVFRDKWIRPLLLAEFAVGPDRSMCPSSGMIEKDDDGVYVRSAGEPVYFWFRLQGNDQFFLNLWATKVLGRNVPDPAKQGLTPVEIKLVNIATQQIHPIKFSAPIDGVKALAEVGWNQERLKTSETGVKYPKKTRFFDWRFRFNAENLAAGRYLVQVIVGGSAVSCRDNLIGTCGCAQDEANCGVQVDIREAANE